MRRRDFIKVITGSAVGVTIPSGVLSIADEVIEELAAMSHRPKQTSAGALHMSAIDPKRTLGSQSVSLA